MRDNDVTIVDIKMPFVSMVVFMVKAAVASIPAFFILSIVGGIMFSLMGVVVSLFGGHL